MALGCGLSDAGVWRRCGRQSELGSAQGRAGGGWGRESGRVSLAWAVAAIAVCRANGAGGAGRGASETARPGGAGTTNLWHGRGGWRGDGALVRVWRGAGAASGGVTREQEEQGESSFLGGVFELAKRRDEKGKRDLAKSFRIGQGFKLKPKSPQVQTFLKFWVTSISFSKLN